MRPTRFQHAHAPVCACARSVLPFATPSLIPLFRPYSYLLGGLPARRHAWIAPLGRIRVCFADVARFGLAGGGGASPWSSRGGVLAAQGAPRLCAHLGLPGLVEVLCFFAPRPPLPYVADCLFAHAECFRDGSCGGPWPVDRIRDGQPKYVDDLLFCKHSAGSQAVTVGTCDTFIIRRKRFHLTAKTNLINRRIFS